MSRSNPEKAPNEVITSINAFDVASYILSKTGEIPAVKLQKLTYYSHVWSLVWDEKPLFNDRIEAWANGPVIPSLYFANKGFYSIRSCSGDPKKLTQAQTDTIDRIIAFYAKHDSQWLSDLTHREDPWRNARIGLADGERGNNEITNEAIMEYYSALPG